MSADGGRPTADSAGRMWPPSAVPSRPVPSPVPVPPLFPLTTRPAAPIDTALRPAAAPPGNGRDAEPARQTSNTGKQRPAGGPASHHLPVKSLSNSQQQRAAAAAAAAAAVAACVWAVCVWDAGLVRLPVATAPGQTRRRLPAARHGCDPETAEHGSRHGLVSTARYGRYDAVWRGTARRAVLYGTTRQNRHYLTTAVGDVGFGQGRGRRSKESPGPARTGTVRHGTTQHSTARHGTTRPRERRRRLSAGRPVPMHLRRVSGSAR